MKQCIREFDKSMSTKSNKVEMALLKTELFDKFINKQHWDKQLAHFNVMKDELKSNHENIETKLMNFEED